MFNKTKEKLFAGKTENKLSLSIDSIDSSPNLESHRRSKSILKNKSDASKVLTDPESERLLADNMSGAGISDISVGFTMVSRWNFCFLTKTTNNFQGDASSDYSPNKLPMSVNKSISPPLNQRHRILIQQRSVPAGLTSSKPIKFQLPRYPEEQFSRQGKPILHKSAAVGASGVDHLTGDERTESVTRDSSIGEF